jgi:transposase, IS30 family
VRYPREQVRVFWRARLVGAAHEDATALAGVSPSCGRYWVREAGGVVPDLASPSGRYLSLAEREEIAIGVAAGLTDAQIARRIGRHRSTVGRELRRNRTIRRNHPAPLPDGRPRPRGAVPDPGAPRRSRAEHRDRQRVLRAARRRAGERARYRAVHAQAKAEERARRPKPGKLALRPQLREQVQAWLELRWSPEQIARRLHEDYPDRPEMRVSHETIYRALYVQGRGELRRELTQCLRTGRALRRPRRFASGRGGSAIRDKIMISDRPAEAADRAVPGHWEGDLILGKDCRSAIGTLVERTTRFVMLLHLPGSSGAAPAPGERAEQVRDAMIAAIGQMPVLLRRSLTWDQGLEMTRHHEISENTGMPIYFCDPHSPWQRGSNENTNGLLRQYFPKGSDLSMHSPQHLAAVAVELNGRPRKTLQWKTPTETLDALLSAPATGVATTP